MSNDWDQWTRENAGRVNDQTTRSMPRETPEHLIQNEEALQRAVVSWARSHPDTRLHLLYSVPNEGATSARRGARLKGLGVATGQPDLCLPVPRGPYGALYLELKHGTNDLATSQYERLRALHGAGNAVDVAWTIAQAQTALLSYLTHPNEFLSGY